MNEHITTITSDNISTAWGMVFLSAMKPGAVLRPTCVTILTKDEEIRETPQIRQALDAQLTTGCYSTKVTASTIFPYTYWTQNNPTRQELYTWYTEKFLPRYQARTARRKKTTYFERLIAFPRYERETQQKIQPLNQLEHILRTWEHYRTKGQQPARSKLQGSCFNPNEDHDMTPRFEFPCLQQVGFAYNKNKLTVNGYYTMQYIVERAYGNYLGLYYLGKFMAHEMKLSLHSVNCFTASPILNRTKESLRALETIVRQNI